MKLRATSPGSELPTIKSLGLSLADRRWELPRKTQRMTANFQRKVKNSLVELTYLDAAHVSTTRLNIQPTSTASLKFWNGDLEWGQYWSSFT